MSCQILANQSFDSSIHRFNYEGPADCAKRLNNIYKTLIRLFTRVITYIYRERCIYAANKPRWTKPPKDTPKHIICKPQQGGPLPSCLGLGLDSRFLGARTPPQRSSPLVFAPPDGHNESFFDCFRRPPRHWRRFCTFHLF